MITKLSMIPSWGPHSQEARLDYEFHQLAGIYPLASQLEFESLKSNIQDNGLIHPIVLFEDKILDGRNRYRACRQVGVEPIFEIFTGSFEEAFQYSNSLNSSRRHLTTSQRSLIAARAIIESRNNEGKNLSVKKASTVYGVSEKYIRLLS